MSQIRRHALPLLVAIGAASLVAACGREGSEPTVGERVDQGVAQMGKKAAEAQGSISDAGKAAGQAAQGTA